MRNFLLGCAAAAALITALPAAAADLPRLAPAPVYAPAPVFTWTGFYIGANAGAAWRHDNHDDLFGYSALGVTFPGGFFTGHDRFTGDDRDDVGFTGGLTLGANWQVGQFVLGVEGDINYIDRDILDRFSGVAFTVTRQPGVTFTVFGSDEDDSNWFGTLRARGGLALDRFLIYATGGLAFNGNGEDHVFTVVGRNAAGAVVSAATFASKGEDDLGWTVGGGVEAGITNNVSVKLEYLYVRFEGSEVIDPIASTALGTAVVSDRDNDSHIVRAGVNFKFGGLFGAY